MIDLVDIAENPFLPLKQSEYFSAAFLKRMYLSKISRSNATGKDGIRASKFEEILDQEVQLLDRKIRDSSYRMTTFKERLLLKGAGKAPRQISIPTMRDRLALRACCELLHRSVPNSVGPTPHSVVANVLEAIEKSGENASFVRIDIKDFFPSVIHNRLILQLIKAGVQTEALSVIYSALKTSTGDKSKINLLGIPQGLSISGALAQVYMLPFDQQQSKTLIPTFRYVDDILLIAPTETAKAEFNRIKRALKRIGLHAHPLDKGSKSTITPVEDGIEFLGYNIFKGKNISIKKPSYNKMFKNLMNVFTDYKYRKNIDRTIFRLNLKITGCIVDGKRRGWLMFFSRTKNLSQLKFLDDFVSHQAKIYQFNTAQATSVKRFIKSYYEINCNKNSKYIPNFDKYTENDKIEVISYFSKDPEEVLKTRDLSWIDREFSRIISAEVHSLEEDVGRFS